MIVELNETLSNFILGEATTGSLLSNALIDFSPPNTDFRNALSHVTLNLYLYEIRENLEMRRGDTYIEKNATGVRRARRRSPALIDCSYVITAWSARAVTALPTEEEHSLLSQTLRLLLKHRRIAERHWHDIFADQTPPYPTLVAQPDALRNSAEFWTALNHYPKPSLTYVVTVAMSLHDETALGPIVESESSINVSADYPAAPLPSPEI